MFYCVITPGFEASSPWQQVDFAANRNFILLCCNVFVCFQHCRVTDSTTGEQSGFCSGGCFSEGELLRGIYH